jgi:hypothetical protein
MTNTNDFFDQIMGAVGMDKAPYYCVKCGALLEKIVAKTFGDAPRKLFFCPNKHCSQFGIVTVVAKKK